jgi:hypothetical protein
MTPFDHVDGEYLGVGMDGGVMCGGEGDSFVAPVVDDYGVDELPTPELLTTERLERDDESFKPHPLWRIVLLPDDSGALPIGERPKR